MKTRILCTVLGMIMLFCSLATAQTLSDGKLLDMLASKGLFTEQELIDIKKEIAEIPVCTPENVRSLRIYTILQMRYTYANQSFADYDSSGSNFNIRRLIPVLYADLTENSMVMISLYLPSKAVINTAHYEYRMDGDILAGTLMLGHNCVNFCTEEVDYCTILMAPDRSILCMYFGGGDSGADGYIKTNYGTAEGFSGYHTGAFWNGWIPGNKELIYGVAVTNSKPNDICIREDNGISFWLTLGYQKEEKDFSLKAGVTFGYSTKNVSAIDGGHVLPSSIAAYGDAYGANPYFKMKYKKLTLNAELMYTRLQYGKTRSSTIPLYTTHSDDAQPWGFYALVAYKIWDFGSWGQIEPTVRYTYLDTDGRGVREADVMFKMSSRNGVYNRVHSYYAGIIWSLRGNSLKYMFGLEHLDFVDSPTGGSKATSSNDVFIAQMQFTF